MKKLLIAVSLIMVIFLALGCSSSSSSSDTTTTTTAAATTTTTTTSTTTSTAAATTTTTTTTTTSTSTTTTTTSTTATTLGLFVLSSPAFNSGEAIPVTYTGDGADTSIPLAWANEPDGTLSFTLLMIDLDAGDFIHWMVGSIPSSATMYSAGISGSFPAGEKEYMNDFVEQGYGGPFPPSGEDHTYEVTIYALDVTDTPWADGATVSGASFDAFVDTSSLGSATITGTYLGQ